MNVPELPPAQARVWAIIARHARAGGRVPAAHALRAELGVAHATVRQHLRALERKGLLEIHAFGPGRAPDARLTPAGRAAIGANGVPVIGTIPAGPLGDAAEDAGERLALPARPGWFALRVHGDSMADLIVDGDVVVLQGGVEPRPGEICAVRVNGDRASLKYLEWRDDRARLVPHNPTYPTLDVPLEDVRVDGVYRGLLRGELVRALAEADV